MHPRAGRFFLLTLGLASLGPIPGATVPGHSAQAGDESIAIAVADYRVIGRVSEPVTSGVPIPAQLAGMDWALFDGNQEIPLQTAVLFHRTVPWLLLDFQTSLGASQTRSLTLRRQAPAALPPAPVTIVEDEQRIVVTTGPLRTEVGRTDFNLLDRVWFDRDADGVFGAGDQVVQATPASNLLARDAGSGAVHSGRGAPRRLEWEYRGPLRATLRVDGSYTSGATTLLDYTTRLTWYAGQSWVRIDHTLRNSLAARERYVKLSSARLVLGGTTTTVRVQRSGSFVWSQVTSTGTALELIPPTVVVSTTYAPYASPPVNRVNATVNVDLNGGLILGDLSHHGATWQVDFADLSAAERARRAAAAADPLVARADASHYSELGAFGQIRFGTYDDERNAYRRWGWTWPTPGNPWSEEHSRPRVPDLYPGWSVLDATNDPESDDLWQNLVMFARVQIPFYLDRARAWARHMKWEWAFRTDDFDYAGAWGSFWDGPGTVSRGPILKPPLTVTDSAYIEHNIRYGKAGVSHMWNGGLLDYYYLTGDRDALEAAVDVAEQAERYLGWQDPVLHGVGGNSRFPARCFLVLTRTWEATGNPRWRSAADHAAELFKRSPTYDPRGFFYKRVSEMGPGFTGRFAPDAKQVTPFMMTAVVEALYRYHVATQDPEVRAQLLRIAEFGRDHGLDPAVGYGGDQIVVDTPASGNVLHLSYSQWENTPPIVPYFVATSSACFINALVIGYRLTGDPTYLHRAKRYWNQASKRHYIDPYDRTFATDTQVGRFANSLQGWAPTSLLFPEAGDWPAVGLLFHESARADTTAPARVQDLRHE